MVTAKFTYTAEPPEASQDVAVDKACLSRVGQGLVQDVVDEVDSRLDGENHSLLQGSGCPQAFQAGQVNAIDTLKMNHREIIGKCQYANLTTNISYENKSRGAER